MKTDSELLNRFVTHDDQAAFAALVERHLGWLFATAQRQLCGDAHLAQDAVQLVFNDLVAKAARLRHYTALNAWLFTSLRYTTAKLVRTQQRRRQREHSAAMDPPASEPNVDWDAVRPVIDEALAALAPPHRDAIIQRFFEQADYAAIATRLDLTANAARMRVDRALDQLSAQLQRRGVTSTASALGVVLGTQPLTAAPIGLAATISTTALSTNVFTTASILAMTKAPFIATAVVVATGITLISRESGQQETLRQSLATPPPLWGRQSRRRLRRPRTRDHHPSIPPRRTRSCGRRSPATAAPPR
ncbi:MAG: RNA polymerase sigma factor [Candidatus Synoicihabitans palmerolidicus]|nr:RNA polymerase sigma factor [Candidatus Synoicihabitans palmerolidicus]